jgi:hypothetical protein
MRIHAYTGNLMADAYTSPSLLEGFESGDSSAYDATAVKSVPRILESFVTTPVCGSGSGSGSCIRLPPGKSSSVEFTLPRVRYSAIKGNSAFLTAVAKDLGAYAELPADLFMNLQFSAAANGSVLALLSLPVSASASASASAASASASAASASASAASASTREGFLAAPPNFEAVLYELQADLNTDNVRFNAVNAYLIANPSAIWSPTASDAPASKDTNNKLNFGVVSGAAGGGGGGGATDYEAIRKQMGEESTDAPGTGPTIINETIIIERPQKPDQPTFTGNFFVDLTNEILSDAASILNVFAGLFNFFNPPKPKATSASVRSSSASLPMPAAPVPISSQKRRIAPSAAPSEPVIYDTSQPTVKFANKPKEVLDAEGKVYFKTEGDTSNDPTLTDKERRAAWRKVYPKGGR